MSPGGTHCLHFMASWLPNENPSRNFAPWRLCARPIPAILLIPRILSKETAGVFGVSCLDGILDGRVGGRVGWQLYETIKDMKSMKALKGGVSWLWGFLFGEKCGRLLENSEDFRQNGGRLGLGRVSTGTRFLGKAIRLLGKAIPFLGKTILFLWKVIPFLGKATSVVWRVKNVSRYALYDLFSDFYDCKVAAG